MQYAMGRKRNNRQILYAFDFPSSGFYIAGCPDWAFLYLEEHAHEKVLTSFWAWDALEFA